MDFIFNDLSLHSQFENAYNFIDSLDELMRIRSLLIDNGFMLYYVNDVGSLRVSDDLSLRDAFAYLDVDKKRAFLSWISNSDFFWSAEMNHPRDAYIAHKDDIVTDTIVGEVAWNYKNGFDQRLVSMSPSEWCYTPLQIQYIEDQKSVYELNVLNYWLSSCLEPEVVGKPRLIDSWDLLEREARNQFANISFAPDAFIHLLRMPFNNGAKNQFFKLMQILSGLKKCYSDLGMRTDEGHEIISNFFTGDNALFSDSSPTEKSLFKAELTFKHPEKTGETIFCPWHGKIKIFQLRVHFSWPVNKNEKLYVVYVGPKITKR